MTNKLNPVHDGYHTVQHFVATKDASKFIDFTKEVFDAKENEEGRTLDDDGLLT